MQLSIIIPVYNEAEQIGTLVNYLLANTDRDSAEIIVCDGGSTDDTTTIAKKAGALTFISPQKGRAAQMNHGAMQAKGRILYFVHADTLPPASFLQDIIAAVEKGYGMGRYRTRFSGHRWYLKINAWFTRFDWFICMGGDNSLFITRALFEQEKGFDGSMQIMEEYEFCERVRKKGIRYKILNGHILVSDRKYDTNSWWRVQMANKKIVSMYRKGATQEAMKKQYKQMLNYR